MERSRKQVYPPIEKYIEQSRNAANSGRIPKIWVMMCEYLLHLWETVPEKMYDDDIMSINDRFVIAGTRNITWELAYELMILCSKNEFDDCYMDDEEGLNTNTKLKSLMELEKLDRKDKGQSALSETYKWELSEELAAMWDKIPTPQHALRLEAAANRCGVNFNIMWLNDYDIRMRKRYRCFDDKSITTVLMEEFLFFIIKDPNSPPEKNQFIPLWLKVGNKCAWYDCCKTNPRLICSRCKKTFYCNKDHQVQDWKKRHKNTCVKPESPK